MNKFLKYKNWYKDSRKIIRRKFKTDYKLFTALLASTSPRFSVKKNLNVTLKIYQAYKKNPDKLKRQALNNEYEFKTKFKIFKPHYRNVLKSLLHNYKKPLTLSGLKVNSFYNNLIGNYFHVTIDTWIIRYFNLDPDKVKNEFRKKTVYAYYSKAIRKLGKRHNLKPAQIQAVIWIKIRTESGFKPVSFTDFLKDNDYEN